LHAKERPGRLTRDGEADVTGVRCGGKQLTGDAEKAEQSARRGKFSTILDPEGSAEGRSPSSFLHNEQGVPALAPAPSASALSPRAT